MSISPAGTLSKAQGYLRDTLAASSTFQELVGAGSAADAKGQIYHEGLPDPDDGEAFTLAELQKLRPYAVIWTAAENGFQRTFESSGADDTFDASGSLIMRLERDAPPPKNDEPASTLNTDWLNVVGQILDDLCELRRGAGYLMFETVTLEEWYWSDPVLAETQGQFQGARIRVDW